MECVAGLLCLSCLVGAAGGFAPSIEAPPATSEPPPTTTVDAALLPAFVGRHNTTVTVHAGDTATLSCHVVRLGDKTVSWARRRGDDFHILTVGLQAYYSDDRYTLSYEYPNNWKLQIRYTQKRDEGLYECQISTHPPRIMRVFLTVSVPDIEGTGSTGGGGERGLLQGGLHSGAAVRGDARASKPPRAVESQPAAQSPPCLSEESGWTLLSWVPASARGSTSPAPPSVTPGTTTCTAGDTVTAGVRVHVLDGESSAAMQHPKSGGGRLLQRPTHLLLPLVTSLLALT
ncbi:uncharacterized protein LOC135114834 [Scylla paramamosain]|uniref:uncharacterized protein LOC135114834 n=1 Tax=Scylla paramamosain TaxID=85552 RepID=UPI003083C88D